MNEAILENCERCHHLMPEDCIGWCAECDAEMKRDPHEDFWEWGGWRRAFAEPCDDYVPGTVCATDTMQVKPASNGEPSGKHDQLQS